MKLKELAEKHNLDVTELSCAVSVAVGKELGPDDEIEITDEVVSSIKDFLGIDIASAENETEEEKRSEEGKEISEETDKQKDRLDDGAQQEQDIAKDGQEKNVEASNEEEQKDKELVEKSEQVVSSEEKKVRGEDSVSSGESEEKAEEVVHSQEEEPDKKEDKKVEVNEDIVNEIEKKTEEEPESIKDEQGEGKDKNIGEDQDRQEEKAENSLDVAREDKKDKSEGEDKAESVQEAGASHQEAYLQDRGDEEVAAREAVPGGEDNSEGVGDERRLLLGEEVPAASSAFQSKEEKIPVDQISVREEGQKTEMASEVVSSEYVETETVTVVSDDRGQSLKKKIDPMMIVSIVLLVIALLSLLVVVVGIIKVSSKKNSDKGQTIDQQVIAYTDADFFALIYRMIERGDLLAAKDMYEDMSVRFPESKFLDDLSMSLGDAFFSQAKATGMSDYFMDAQRFYRRAYDLSQKSITKQQALIKFCRCLKQTRRWMEASKWFKEFIEEFPKSSYVSEAMLSLAQSLENLGKEDEAISVLNELANSQIKDDFVAEGMLLLINLLSKEGKWNEVKKNSYMFLQEFPEHHLFPEVLFLLGEALGNTGELQEAENVYMDATQKLEGDWLVKALMKLAEIYIKEGKIDDAIGVYERIVSEFKYNRFAPQAMFNESRLYYLMGNYKKALDMLFVLKERYYKWEKMPEVFWLMSCSFAREENFSSSEKFLRKILRKWKDYFPDWKVEWRLAHVLELQGKYISAVRFYDKMLGDISIQDNESRWFKVMLARADDLMRSKQYDKAIGVFVRLLSDLKQASKDNSEDQEKKQIRYVSIGKSLKVSEDMLLYRLSVAYFYAGQYSKAIDSFRDLIGSYPLSLWRFKARFMLGRTYQATGQLQLAIDQYTKVAVNRFLADDELKSRSWEELGRIYLKLGRSDESYDALVKARELTRKWDRAVELLLLQADALVGRRKFDSAIKLYGSYLDKMLKRYKVKIMKNGDKFSFDMGIKDEQGFKKIVDVLVRIADANYRKGDYRSALKVYSKVQDIFISRHQDAPGWVLFQMGMCYNSIGQKEMADLFFDKVIELYPNSMWAKEARWQKHQTEVLGQINSVKQVLETIKK